MGRVLFFGKSGCVYSNQAFDYLKLLGFDVQGVWSKTRTEKLDEDVTHWEGDYILCFRSYYLLSPAMLKRASVAAINFHPAPVEYPGSGCLNWALYDDAKVYGVTAHIMTKEIDAGPVVECRRFPVLPNDTVTTLLARAHQKTYDLIVDTVTGLALEGKPYLDRKLAESKAESWNGKARKMHEIDALQIIDKDCSKEELERVIRATYTPAFPPHVMLHGRKFVLAV